MSDGNKDPRDPSLGSSDSPSFPSGPDAWISEDDIKALAEEREILGNDEVQQAEEILRTNLPAAVHSLVKLARAASSETVRMNSAKYIVDRNLGKVGDIVGDDEESPTELLIKGVTVVQ